MGYSLDKSSKKYVCPKCGKRSFVLYLSDDGTGKPLSDKVGKCDHQNSCGYHYRPRDYFSDHPGQRAFGGYYRPLFNRVKEPSFLDKTLVIKKEDKALASDFCQFLLTLFDRDKVADTVHKYMLGATRPDPTQQNMKHVIYWQIDYKGICRAGKIMKYDATTGHRLKGDGKGYVDWVHSHLLNTSYVPYGWQDKFTQCFFGEHLLNTEAYPENADKPICICEAEKTAVIMSMVFPHSIWLSVGGEGNLRKIFENEGDILKGHDIVVLYPDCSCYDDWKAKVAPYVKAGLKVEVSDILEKNHAKPGSDIADYIIDAMQHNVMAEPQQKENKPQNDTASTQSDNDKPFGTDEPFLGEDDGKTEVPVYDDKLKNIIGYERCAESEFYGGKLIKHLDFDDKGVGFVRTVCLSEKPLRQFMR